MLNNVLVVIQYIIPLRPESHNYLRRHALEATVEQNVS